MLQLGGTVRIRVRGASIERFLNICSRHDLTLREIDRIDFGELNATMTLADFRRLRSVMGRTGCRVHLLARHGAPFTLHRFRRRYALFGGLLALAAMCFVLTNFIWVIRMPVPEGLSARVLERELTVLGVHAGMPASSLDQKAVQDAMMQRVPELAFIALTRHGNRIDVELHVRDPKPTMLDADALTDVRAAKAGVLTRVTATGGQTVKQPGETVEAGEIVISSLVMPTTEQGQPRLTHGAGTVEARTWYEKTARRATAVGRKVYTGQEKTRYALSFGKNRVNLYLGSSISEGSCDKIIDEMKIVIADSVELPVRLVRETSRYYETEPFALEAEALRPSLEARAQERLLAAIDGSITASTAVLREIEGGAELTLYAECLEQIGCEALTTQEVPPPDAGAEGEKNQ